MSNWSVDGETTHLDVRHERIAAGTVGGEHVQPQGLAGGKFNAVIDDTDTRILYGAYGAGTAVFTQDNGDFMTDNMTQTIIGGRNANGVQANVPGKSGSAAQLKFKGTSIGVLGSTNPYSGVMTVYIDGVATAGRLPAYMPLYIGNASVNSPVVAKSSTTITAYGANANFPAGGGTILLGSELITYTSKGSDPTTGYDQFTGCTRGTGGTTSTDHYAYESIFLWGNSVDLSTTTDYSTKQLLYYNPFLQPGDHSITIVVSTSSVSNYARIYFDGFVVGSLVGAQNLYTQTGTMTAQVSIDANGHGILGQLFYPPSNVVLIGMLGYTQSVPTVESSNTTTMGRLGLTRTETYGNGETWPYYYIHNGPPNTIATFIFTFTYIGETL